MKFTYKNIVFYLSCAFIAVILILPSVAENAIISAVKTTVITVVPALFPFMVISGILCEAGAPEPVKTLFKPLCRLLRIPDSCSSVILVGNLCGFPVGASSVCSLVLNGEIDRESGLRTAVLSNNVSISFALSYVGSVLFSCRKLALVMWLSQLISCIFICFAESRIQKSRHHRETVKIPTEEKHFSLSKVFTSSVSRAALGCLSVAAFICFFSIVKQYVSSVLTKAGLPILSNIISLILEIASACNLSATYSYPLSAAFCCFAMGFSGLCVICQSAVYLSECGISTVRFTAMKLLQGVLSGLISFVLCLFIKFDVSVSSLSPTVNLNSVFTVVSFFLFIIYIIIKIKELTVST